MITITFEDKKPCPKCNPNSDLPCRGCGRIMSMGIARIQEDPGDIKNLMFMMLERSSKTQEKK